MGYSARMTSISARPGAVPTTTSATATTAAQGGPPHVAGPSTVVEAQPAPHDVYEAIPAVYTRPSAHMGTSFNGYSWRAEDLDAVMKQFAIGDATALIQTAIALKRGERVLSAVDLVTAARSMAARYTQGVRFSPSVVADIMLRRGIAEESALLRAARKLDDGDRFLSRAELEAAADVLQGIVQANDISAVEARIADLTARGVSTTTLGVVDGHSIAALHLPHTGAAPQPRLKVVVTGGVHGNEPCGTAAAMLLLEQLMADPRLREDVAFVVVPLVNPRGYAQGTRRTPDNIDVNRSFGTDAEGDSEEARLLRAFYDDTDVDLAIDLHAGYSSRDGFWLYHVNAAELAADAMSGFAEDFPTLSPQSAGKPMVAPGVVESAPRAPGEAHAGTLKDYAIDAGARWSFTVEAPGSVGYVDQVMGENELVHQLVQSARRLQALEAERQG